MLNVSGHLLSTAQVESALIEHKGLVIREICMHIILYTHLDILFIA